MSEEVEGTYEYECMRAELLGLEKPDYEEYIRNHPPQQSAANEEVTAEVLQNVDLHEEGLKNVSGGLVELNSLLSVTQKKLNRFKATCGSLTNLLKIRVGHGSTDSINSEKQADDTQVTKKAQINCESGNVKDQTEQDSSGHITRDVMAVDKLDSLLNQAERAELSMSQQNKQMKRFLNR